MSAYQMDDHLSKKIEASVFQGLLDLRQTIKTILMNRDISQTC